MKPLFTIHEGEFLVGDHINRKLGHMYDVWVPTKDTGVDLLITRKQRQGKAVGVQVKFSRSFNIDEEFSEKLIATSWYKLDPAKVRESKAELWVFVILTLKHKEHYVVIPKIQLQKRIPNNAGRMWNMYLWVFDDRSCFQVRGISRREQLQLPHRSTQDRQRDFSKWLENWDLLDELTNITSRPVD